MVILIAAGFVGALVAVGVALLRAQFIRSLLLDLSPPYRLMVAGAYLYFTFTAGASMAAFVTSFKIKRLSSETSGAEPEPVRSVDEVSGDFMVGEALPWVLVLATVAFLALCLVAIVGIRSEVDLARVSRATALVTTALSEAQDTAEYVEDWNQNALVDVPPHIYLSMIRRSMGD